MAIVRGNPRHVSIHHDAVNGVVWDMEGLRQRASAHNSHHQANAISWGTATPGEYGYQYILYHYLINGNGEVLQTQGDKYSLFANGDGAYGTFNSGAVNICFPGYFHSPHNNEPTEKMIAGAVKLLRNLQQKYNINPQVKAHRDISATACPGDLFYPKVQDIINKVNDQSYNPDLILNPVETTVIGYVTVQNGWGLSYVAQFAGFEDWATEARWQAITDLNPGVRGHNGTWQSLNARMGAGDVLKVRETVTTTNAVVEPEPITLEPLVEEPVQEITQPQEIPVDLISSDEEKIINNINEEKKVEKTIIDPMTLSDKLKNFQPYGTSTALVSGAALAWVGLKAGFLLIAPVISGVATTLLGLTPIFLAVAAGVAETLLRARCR
jgi:hypothetical protein